MDGGVGFMAWAPEAISMVVTKPQIHAAKSKAQSKKLLATSLKKCHSHDVLKYFVDIFKMQVDFMNDVYELNLH